MKPTYPLRFLSRIAFALAMGAVLAGSPITARQSLANDGPPELTEPTDSDAGRVALEKARALIESEDWHGAITELEAARDALPKTADVYNLLGYSQRKLRRFDRSLSNYRQALRLDPKHKGALEYLGELYVETGRMDKARETARYLARLCLDGCEQLSDLRAAIARKPGI